MSQNEIQPKVFVHAMIPATPADTQRAIVDWRGQLPSIEHGQGTYEETLTQVGREKLGVPFLSVQSREYTLENSNTDRHHHIVYSAKISSHDVDAIPRNMRLDRPRLKQQNALFAAARHLTLKVKEGVINSYYDATIYGNYLPRH